MVRFRTNMVHERTNYDPAMNLYLRLLWALWRACRLPRIGISDTIERPLRVWPNDLDVNGHMNNGRYLTLVDQLLVEYFARCGFARVIFKNGWRPMAGGAFVSYRKGLKPFERYRLAFEVVGHDLQWNYMRFRFLRQDGTLCAVGYVKGAVVGAQGFVPNRLAFERLGQPFPEHALPEAVQHWLAAEQAAMASVKP
jgi:acyl-CoA thioesterase FadM